VSTYRAGQAVVTPGALPFDLLAFPHTKSLRLRDQEFRPRLAWIMATISAKVCSSGASKAEGAGRRRRWSRAGLVIGLRDYIIRSAGPRPVDI
jgi:hypothetical protein